MPSRMIRDWTDSDPFDGLSANAERLFVRLIMKADDYGRFHAESRRVKAACFPLMLDLRPSDVDGWLNELEARRLIWRYEVGSAKYLAIPKFGQRLRKSKARFAQPEGEPDNWRPPETRGELAASSGKSRQVAASCGEFPPEEEVEVEEKKKEKRKAADAAIPSRLQVPKFMDAWKEWLAFRAKRKSMSYEAATKQLATLAEYGVDVAVKAINASIASDWQGLFPDKYGKPTQEENREKPGLTPEEIHRLCDQIDGEAA